MQEVLWGSKAARRASLFAVWALCCTDGPPLSLAQQLCRVLESKTLSSLFGLRHLRQPPRSNHARAIMPGLHKANLPAILACHSDLPRVIEHLLQRSVWSLRDVDVLRSARLHPRRHEHNRPAEAEARQRRRASERQPGSIEVLVATSQARFRWRFQFIVVFSCRREASLDFRTRV